MRPTFMMIDSVLFDEKQRTPRPLDVVVFDNHVVHRYLFTDFWGYVWETGDHPRSPLQRRPRRAICGIVLCAVKNGQFIDLPHPQWLHYLYSLSYKVIKFSYQKLMRRTKCS